MRGKLLLAAAWAAWAASAAYGQNLITLDIGGTAGTWTGSGSSVGTYRIEFRLENVAALRAVMSNGSGTGNLNCMIDGSLVLSCSQGGDGTPQGIPAAQLSSGQDARVRFQRDSIGLTTTIETWSGNCQSHSKQQFSITSGGSLPQASTWVAGPSIDVAFLRGYSALDTGGDCPADAPVAAGDLFDFTFEGNSLVDRSSHAYTMSAAGASFANSAVYPPAVGITGWSAAKPVFRAGQPFTLTGSASQCFTYPGTGVCSSYFWTQIAGPGPSAITTRASVSAGFTPPVAGQYTYQLTIADNTGATISGTQSVGVVATDSNGIAIFNNADFQYALGNPMMYGQSPWPWFDATEAADVDLMSAPVQAPINEVTGPGTCTVPSGSPNQISAGNITALTYGGVAIVCAGSNFTSADVGNYIALHWDADGDGSFRGRMVVLINQFISSTVVVTNQFDILEPAASLSTGLAWTWLAVGSGTCSPAATAAISGGQVTAINASGCSGFYWWSLGLPAVSFSGGGGSGCSGVSATVSTGGGISGVSGLPCGSGYSSAPTVAITAASDWLPYEASEGGSFVFDFYEAGLGIGRLWARTGLTTYQTEFHGFCTNWWRWALDSGYYNGALPRNAGLDFMLACAADPTYSQPANMWAGIARIAQAIAPGIVYNASTGADTSGFNPTQPAAQALFDPRENSYILRPSAILAKLGGNHGLSSSTLCANLANQVNNIWIPGAAQPVGYPANTYSFYPENIFFGNVSEPGAGIPAITGPFGTSPWRSDGLPTIALIMAYQTLEDTGTCNNATLAARLFTAGGSGSGLIPQLASYIYTFGRSQDGGLFTAASYGNDTNGEDPTFEDYMAPNFHFYGQLVTYAGGGATTVAGTNGATIFTHQFWSGATISLGGTNCTVASVANDYTLTLNSGCSAGALSSSGNWGNPNTIQVASGSAAVTGTNTHFTTQFAAPYIYTCVYNAATNDRNCFSVTVTDDTHLALNTTYPGTTASGINTYLINRIAPSNCGPNSVATACNADIFGGRNLSADIAFGAGWLYQQTRATSWQSKATYYMNKLFGGAAGGAGAAGTPTGTLTYSPGTITIVASSNAVVGTGTAFLTEFACNGTDSLTMADGVTNATWFSYANLGNPNRTPNFLTVQLDSCTDNTHATLHLPWPGSGSTNTNMFYNVADPNWQGADGAVGNLGEILPGCSSNAPPCGIADFVPKYGKPLGMASGAGNVPLAMADRVGGVAAANNRSFTVAFELGAVLNATQVTVSITTPDQNVASNTCSSSPCAVTADAREGAAELSIQYKSAGGAILSSSTQPVFFAVR